MEVKGRILLVCLSINLALAWENLPQLPTGRRSQYFLQEADGAYKYGFDTGDNFFAKQSGDAQNQVEGHFKYNLNGGKSVDVRYTSGVQGYVPSGLDEVQSNLGSLGARVPASSVSAPYPPAGSPYSSDNSANNDGSYSFSYDTGDSSRQESADAQGNVRGQYAYRNEAGNHDLSYVAGSATGFLPTGGSLSVPNGLGGGAGGAGGAPSISGYGGGGFSGGSQPGASFSTGADDGSYSFSYNTGDSSREESADSQNNVRGRYSYTNSAGNHDLSYVAGAQTGFVATGGSLAVPNGLTGKTVTPLPGLGSSGGYPGAGAGAGAGSGSPFSAGGSGAPNADGSYSFSYNTGDSSREESADSQNNVKGRYSYTNSAGNHDLSYVAGADTGFVATGGSLATPNGLAGKNAGAAPSPYSGGSGFGLNPRTGGPAGPASGSGVPNADGSYSFSYNTGDSSRQESADSQNNVQGRYSYTNAAGNHDLSYVAGAQTGFVATGGSLATPNGLTGKTVTPLPGSYGGSGGPGAYSGGPGAYSGGAGGAAGGSSTLNADGSYSFSYNTGDASREESADSQNNVKGRYSYTNSAGNHDLSYVAGSQTGFLPTGGSLATPNGLTGKSQTPFSGAGGSGAGVSGGAGSSGAQNADGSYSFSYNTGDSAREESADSQNNVRGRYSYTNSAGNHDLSYIAGAQTGFVATGGSLATPNGLAGKAAAGYSYGGGSSSYSHSPSLNNEYLPPSKGHSKPTSYSLGNVLVQTYLPPSSGVKFGYIFDTKN